MSNDFFILSDAVYNNGLFPQIPNYRKTDSWFLLTEGSACDIVVNDRTTVKEIRKGRYQRLVEISKKAYSYLHTFDSACKEVSYTFKVKVKANVFIENPIDFYSNIRSVNTRDFFSNQFSIDVRKITKNYSILNYDGIDDDLRDILPRTRVLDSTCGLAYQIQTVETMPNEAALKILGEKESDYINRYLEEQKMVGRADLAQKASALAGLNRGKTYEDAIWGEVAVGKLTEVEAIRKIDDYNSQSHNERLQRLLELRNENIISDEDIEMQKQLLLPVTPAYNQQKLVTAIRDKEDSSFVDEYFE